MKQPKQHKEK